MKFVTYAQNFEDILLWRALKFVEKGFYVDIGAHHPIVDSVSKAFYERGWRGIHIEPVAEYANLLRADRPDELVLQLAVGDINGSLELNVISDTGLSTAIDKYAEQHHLRHGFQSERVKVRMETLKTILAPYVNQEIHWLKIDVEGFEEQVLKGWDGEINRPWIMVVESTRPLSQSQSHAKWDHFLTSSNYVFVYFDGLNRYYVAQEHIELKNAFSTPVNLFDDFSISETASPQLWLGFKEQLNAKEMTWNLHNESLNTKISQLCFEKLQIENELRRTVNLHDESEKRLLESKNEIINLSKKLDVIHDSISWKITKPLREISNFYHRFIRKIK